MTRLSPMDGLPLPELVDFRVTGDRQKVILFVREGEVFYRRHLNVRKGARLWTVNPSRQSATFVRGERRTPASDEQPFERIEKIGAFSVCVTREQAEALCLVFLDWEMPEDFWPVEGVPVAQSLSNAAD